MDQEKSFLEVYLKHQDEIRAYVNAVERQASARDDIFQEVSMVLVKKFESYNSEQPFSYWAKGVAKNVILNRWKKVGRSKILFSEEVMEVIRDSFEKVEEESSDQRTALRDCIKKLPINSRQILTHKYEDRLSVEDVAQKVNRSFESVKKTFFRLRTKLRECIEMKLTSGVSS